MNHKDKKTINIWLKDLTEKECLKRIYSDHFLEKTKPAIYYIAIEGIRYLKTLTYEEGEVCYPIEELRKRYRESERSQSFIDQSIMIAQCCVDLQTKANNNYGLVYHTYTKAEYRNENCKYNFLTLHETIQPSLCIIKLQYDKEKDATGKEAKCTNFLIEIIDPNLPRYRLKKRLKEYIVFLSDNVWKSDRDNNNPPPITMLVLPSLVDLIYAKRCAKSFLIKEGYEPGDEFLWEIPLQFTTSEKLQQKGVTASIWEVIRGM